MRAAARPRAHACALHRAELRALALLLPLRRSALTVAASAAPIDKVTKKVYFDIEARSPARRGARAPAARCRFVASRRCER